MAMVYLLMVISSRIASQAPSPVGCQPETAQCTRSLKRRLPHVHLPVMSTYEALFEKGFFVQAAGRLYAVRSVATRCV